MVALELAVQDLEGIAIASRVGADRIELCSALSVGGLTPSLALVEAAAAAPVAAHVLIRPRAGGFGYTAEERAVIVRDLRHVLAAGAAGVVVGGTSDGGVDAELLRAVTDAAGPAPITFHRAFDTLGDRIGALDVLVQLGVSRVLTSGGAASAVEGRGELTRLVRHAAGRIEIMAGGGVVAANVSLVVATGVDAVHASAKRVVAGSGIHLGSAGESVRETTDEELAGRLRAILDGARRV
ncbi:copper homeostasis protein CutC [Actinotalea sp. K2]|uniref:copper homeostasis protein CutC n=1 Tax=Actinotalea sp. K2 TaxID=2939438 RepID=UPI0020179F4E|nr:copper homeostasis protein CutC [Actinotalea sp. K2]MCL3859608.1 copper homeostasis protein CutC [Actinotalea sp. K2]